MVRPICPVERHPLRRGAQAGSFPLAAGDAIQVGGFQLRRPSLPGARHRFDAKRPPLHLDFRRPTFQHEAFQGVVPQPDGRRFPETRRGYRFERLWPGEQPDARCQPALLAERRGLEQVQHARFRAQPFQPEREVLR